MRTPPRPAIDADLVRSAMAGGYSGFSWTVSEISDLVECYRVGIDGYELARRLEDECGWTIRADLVSRLDYVDSVVRQKHRVACEQWVHDFSISPPCPIGATIKEGVIKCVSLYYPASYEVQAHGEVNPNRRVIVHFEDAVASDLVAG